MLEYIKKCVKNGYKIDADMYRFSRYIPVEKICKEYKKYSNDTESIFKYKDSIYLGNNPKLLEAFLLMKPTVIDNILILNNPEVDITYVIEIES